MMTGYKYPNYARLQGHPRSVISYIGGKSRLVPIINSIIEYVVESHGLTGYAELCGGGARMLLNLPSTHFSNRLYNDINPALCSLFSCLGNLEETLAIMEQLLEWGVDKETYLTVQAEYNNWLVQGVNFRDPGFNRVYAGAAVYMLSGLSRAGTLRSFDHTKLQVRETQRYLRRVQQLPTFVPSLEGVEVENKSLFELLGEDRDWTSTFTYLDPPYINDMMLSKGHYGNGDHSFSNADHERLVKLLLQHDGILALSGIDSNIYSMLEANGWNKYYLKRLPISSSGVTGRYQEEILWINIELPSSLLEMITDVDRRLLDY